MKKIIIVLLVALLGAWYWYYKQALVPNVNIENSPNPYRYLYIPTGANYQQVEDSITINQLVKDLDSFKRCAKWLKYNDNTVRAGRYKLDSAMSNKAIIELLKSGEQAPVSLVFNNIRTKEQFAGYVGRRLEFDSLSLISLLNDNAFLLPYGFTSETIFTMFIPNTYEFLWNTNEKKFFQRMNREYDVFWTLDRIEKAKSLNMTPQQVSILASIVHCETRKSDEMPTVAGVYTNRLCKGMRLEADPTVIFAAGDFSIRRVRGAMLKNPSVYNTYQHKGLPPGPIGMPSVVAIDAVLENEKHKYIYFCAKEDFSGYHSFAENYSEHLKNASKFKKALNERGIK